jgi:hypothetical protein
MMQHAVDKNNAIAVKNDTSIAWSFNLRGLPKMLTKIFSE